jgi:small subunit ribosomal protein S20e
VRLPTKTLRITTASLPGGEGTNTWDRIRDAHPQASHRPHAPADLVKQITSISIEPGVEAEVTMQDL